MLTGANRERSSCWFSLGGMIPSPAVKVTGGWGGWALHHCSAHRRASHFHGLLTSRGNMAALLGGGAAVSGLIFRILMEKQ